MAARLNEPVLRFESCLVNWLHAAEVKDGTPPGLRVRSPPSCGNCASATGCWSSVEGGDAGFQLLQSGGHGGDATGRPPLGATAIDRDSPSSLNTYCYIVVTHVVYYC